MTSRQRIRSPMYAGSCNGEALTDQPRPTGRTCRASMVRGPHGCAVLGYLTPVTLVQSARLFGNEVLRVMGKSAVREAKSRQLARIAVLVLPAILTATLWASPAMAQSGLTPDQQQLLNSLPPAQRQQALQALQNLNQQQSAGEVAGEPPATPSGPVAPVTDVPAEVGGAPQAEPGTRLIVTLTEKVDLPAEEARILDEDAAIRQVVGSNYYELDDVGTLVLPGLASVPLLGLTGDAIQQRLGAEPALSIFDVEVRILDTRSVGAEALEPFGYDVFAAPAAGFVPVTTGPVPPDYILGPGDSVRVQLFGNTNGIYEFEVTRDGTLTLPELGPITVAGLPFSEFRADVRRRVEEMLIGTQVSVTMGKLRTIGVFVLGDANRPGSYIVNSLATISTALYLSGGISEIGSLRNIELKRQGQAIARLDLYDLLIRGDTSNDRRLQPGDVIFIPPLGDTVGIAGAVRRPAIYEIKGRTTIGEAIRFAGGMLPNAYPDLARLERIDSSRRRVVISVDAGSDEGSSTSVSAGDTLTIPEVLQEFSGAVELAGHVQRPGPYQWRRGMRLTDLISSGTHLNPGADKNYVLIRRETGDTRQVEVVSADLAAAFSDRSSVENVELQERDTVHVFSLEFGRQRVIEPIISELALQSRFGDPLQQVSVDGRVRAPGTYPLEPDMRVSDLIRAGGNMSEDAYTGDAELTRYSILGDQQRATDVIDINLAAILRGDTASDIALEPHDHLSISTIPEWDSEWSVVIDGEVRFPGEYRIRRGETLTEVLSRAGGLTDEAFPEGGIFLRDSLKQREQEQIDLLAQRLEADLASLSLQSVDTTGAETLSTGRALLDQLRSTEAVGRLVIDVSQLALRHPDGTRINDVELRDGDRLLIPKQSHVVTVIGETQQNTSHLFQPGLTRDDYIQMSGGVTRRADRKLIYVVRASGAVMAGSRSRWFGRSGDTEIRPGDTIVVPLDADRIRPLTFWGSVTQILYQAAIAVAAVQTFGN